jgi:hypothetical protein
VTYTFYTERDLAPYEAAPSPEQADYVVYSPNKTPRWYPDPPDRLRAYENCSTYGSYGFNFTHANATAERRWVHLASKGGC